MHVLIDQLLSIWHCKVIPKGTPADVHFFLSVRVHSGTASLDSGHTFLDFQVLVKRLEEERLLN